MPTRPTRNDMIFRIESALAEVAQYAGSARNHERIMSAAGVGIDQSAYPILHQLSRRSSARISDLAIDLNLHVSTVSRALKGKYVQTPQGVQELKAFFTGASQGTDGVVESRTGVRERVRELVEKEEKGSPLSDEEIVDKLKAIGLNVARRTVTKYRKALKIPSSRQRREY